MDYTGCRALTDIEVENICSAFSGKYRLRDRAIFMLGIYTGFRISEILSLKIQDVLSGSRIRNSVTVQRAFMKGKKSGRTMPLHARAQSGIKEWIDSIAGMNSDGCSPLFPCQRTQKRLSPRTFWGNLKYAASHAGVSTCGIGTHSMRKSFTSRLWSSELIGKDLAKMAKLLGHRDPANTLRYIQFLDNSLTDAVLSA